MKGDSTLVLQTHRISVNSQNILFLEGIMSKSVLVPIADGTEEIEAVTIIDVLRRSGARVTVASVDNLQVTASRGVKLVADCTIDECLEHTFDLVALPGGMPGAEHLRDSELLKQLLTRQRDQGRYFAAICAAPAVVLEHHGLLQGIKATTHPAFVERLADASAALSPVVVDGNCITSRGPGTAMVFALELVNTLYGLEKRDEVAGPMVMP
jgi:4-methyl-5(b-hydroxyethyl)-thiazole monophosphate biosynthesis